jgi:hypothetical protein
MRGHSRGGGARADGDRTTGEDRRRSPIPIWESKLYRERRARTVATKFKRDRLKRVEDGRLFREKRAFVDHLLDMCDRAELALRRRGGDIASDLEQIDDLGFIVSLMDSEMGPGTRRERLEELRDYLEAMVLAIEISKLASSLDQDVRNGGM